MRLSWENNTKILHIPQKTDIIKTLQGIQKGFLSHPKRKTKKTIDRKNRNDYNFEEKRREEKRREEKRREEKRSCNSASYFIRAPNEVSLREGQGCAMALQRADCGVLNLCPKLKAPAPSNAPRDLNL